MISVVLLLGGNVGDVEQTFTVAVAQIAQRIGEVTACSSVMRSEAWGFEADEFRNQAVIVSSELDPFALLEVVQSIERECGREREQEKKEKAVSGERYCSRTLDIDIIFYGEQIIESESLTIPHPLVAEREFVLRPIAQIAPFLVNAKNCKSVEQMLNELNS